MTYRAKMLGQIIIVDASSPMKRQRSTSFTKAGLTKFVESPFLGILPRFLHSHLDQRMSQEFWGRRFCVTEDLVNLHSNIPCHSLLSIAVRSHVFRSSSTRDREEFTNSFPQIRRRENDTHVCECADCGADYYTRHR